MDIKKPKRRPVAKSSPATSRSRAKSAKPETKPTNLRKDLDEALRAIDKETSGSTQDPKLGKRKTRAQRKRWSRKRKVITWSIVGFFTLILLITGIYIYRITVNTSGIFEGNIFDALFKNDQLKTDANGRSNILIFGTSEDDEGHSGADLADSIMVLSIDQKTKDAYTVSIPRDLWVDYGISCSFGAEGKINAVYPCALEAKKGDKHQASLAFAEAVSKVVGTDVQYYVAVNYSVVRGLVDSLGGVDVTIHSDDPRGIYDVATGLKLPAGTQHIDGETALDLSRARNSKGGYGLSQSNFDREKNQQQVLKAIQDKALKTGTLTDPNRVVSITESLGKNIRTNVRTSELRTALDIAAGVRSSSIKSKPLNDPDNPLVTTGNHAGQSIVRPIKGLTDYSDIHAYLGN